ncbi:flagellar protein FlgN [Pseudomonas sp. LS44]|uniref:flagella synthesis protein FlgN n=1 Tax=Pseudomonas sp. LS44 TaxID=1357074 RepID=UPI00215A8DA8|nr:flagellar protein FlgN [Pseudomonas sp. LS44]UVE16401.1 flagellar protein FlgN [Pseudomonas sp. LS44]
MHDTTLLHLFTEDIGAAKQLLELIDAEYQALSERDLPRLENLLSDKKPLLTQLAHHGNERSQLLASLELPPDQAGLEAVASQSAQGVELLTRSAELAALLEDCQTANLRNGRIIRASHTSVTSVLSILRGGNETPGLYDSHGSTARIAPQRPLNRA